MLIPLGSVLLQGLCTDLHSFNVSMAVVCGCYLAAHQVFSPSVLALDSVGLKAAVSLIISGDPLASKDQPRHTILQVHFVCLVIMCSPWHSLSSQSGGDL